MWIASLVTLLATLVFIYYGLLVGSVLAVLSFASLRLWPSRRRFAAVLTPHEDRAVHLLIRVAPPLNADEMAQVARFVDDIIGSKDFNGRALARAATLKNYDSYKQALLRDLATVAFKGGAAIELAAAVEALEAAWRLWSAGKPVERRLKREELRALESVARSRPLFDRLNARIQGQSARLRALCDCAARIDGVFVPLLAALKSGASLSDATRVPRTGDLVAYTLENDRYIMGSRRPLLLQWFYKHALGSDATHMAVRLDDKDSHMWGNPDSVYSQTPITIGSFGNKYYRPNPGAYVDQKVWGEKLLRAYGATDFDALIGGLYADAVRDWHKDNAQLLASLRNDAQYRILVALVINTVSLRARPWRERAAFAADAFKTHNQVACSEFVIKASMQAADRLGRAIARKLIETGVDTSVPPSGETVVDPRIDPRRRTARYSPGLLVHRALKLGLFVELPASPLFDALFV